jgi:hypothetical protein
VQRLKISLVKDLHGETNVKASIEWSTLHKIEREWRGGGGEERGVGGTLKRKGAERETEKKDGGRVGRKRGGEAGRKALGNGRRVKGKV